MTMNQQLYDHIKEALARGEITPRDLRALLHEDPTGTSAVSREQNVTLIRILSYVGGIIIFLGALFFVVLQWEILSSPARILISLGTSLVSYSIAAVLFFQNKQVAYLPHTLSLLSLVLLPVGIAVVIYEAGGSLAGSGWQVLISAIVALFAFTSFFLLRRLTLFLVVAIAALTWCYYALATFLTDGGSLVNVTARFFYIWVTLVAGAAYLFIARWLQSTEHRSLASVLEAVGVLAILSAALSGGDLWNIIYPLFLVGAFAGSVYLANRGVLVFASIFLIGYLIKITTLYFLDTIGWPVALIGIGALIIAVSYGAYRLHHKINQHEHIQKR